MAIRSRAASRPCQKSNMGPLYQQRFALAGVKRSESRWSWDSGLVVTRRLLKRFSSREGMDRVVRDGVKDGWQHAQVLG
jgi:hypothetical protein